MARLTVAGVGSLLVAIAVAGTSAVPQKPAPQPAPPASQRPTEVELVIRSDAGRPPRLAVPDFVALTPDAAEAARTIGQVLWEDLNLELEFYLIALDTYATIPAANTIEQIPFASWRELGADGLIFGTVQRTGDTLQVQVRLLDVATGRSALAREYSGTAGNPRLYAHTASDDVHLQQRALRGVARSKLAFVSDRSGERAEGFDVKEVFVSDYDGANQRRVTNSRRLNLSPSWSPDGRAVAYTSFRLVIPDIFISRIYEGILENPLKGVGGNYLPVWSPDGRRIAFFSNRAGNPEIYVMNRDGSNVRRLTNHPATDSTPTWSPNGAQIAFTSDRAGQPQIYVMNSDDGSSVRRLTEESYADRATWSPAPYNEIAFAARTDTGYDIKVLDLATNSVRQITQGMGSNESPAYSPSGRHLAFTSNRGGQTQVYLIGRDGRGERQVTTAGKNYSPAWSR
jgi:TolB protein